MFLKIPVIAIKLVIAATKTDHSASTQLILFLSRVETKSPQAARLTKPAIKCLVVCLTFWDPSIHHLMKKLTRNMIKSEYIKPTLKTIVQGYSRPVVMMLGFGLSQFAHQISIHLHNRKWLPKTAKQMSKSFQLLEWLLLFLCPSYSMIQQLQCLKIIQIMGNTCKADVGPEELGVFNPIQLDFKRVQPVILPPSLYTTLNSIKSIASFPDPRENTGLKWFHSTKFQLYLLGDIQDKKPIGECLFYIKSMNPSSDLPIIIATKIEQKNIYSPNTLLLYPDKSYYLGSIISNGVEPPIADGKGTLVSQKFIFQGQFKNGYPNGYGTFQTKGGILVGEFANGQPCGECVQRTKKGLFIGELLAKHRRAGKLITPENEVVYVNEQSTNSNGSTFVQL